MPDDHELDLEGFLELADSPSSSSSPKRASLLSRVSEHAGRRFSALSSLVSPGTSEDRAPEIGFSVWVFKGSWSWFSIQLSCVAEVMYPLP